MANIVLDDITSGYNLSKINNNFDKIETTLNTDRLQLTNGGNIMDQDLDMNGNDIINAQSISATQVFLNGEQLAPSELVITDAVTQSVLGSDSGAGMVGYKLGATGAVSTTVQDKLAQTVSVKDFGAKGDGVTDDTAAIQAAIDYISNATVGTVNIPAGIYIISSTLTVTGKVSLVGEGMFETIIRWAGVVGGKMLNQTGLTAGARWHGFTLDSNGVAAIGLSIDRMELCEVSSLCSQKATQYLMYMAPQTSDSNCMMNTFTNVYLSAGGISLPGMIALHIGSDAAGVNCCHNTFIGLKLEHGAIGIQFGDADNNSFLMTYCFRRPEATGTPYEVDFAGGSATRSNYFFHFQGKAHASSGSSNTIEMYDKSNGQGEPVIDAGGVLEWRESGQSGKGDFRSKPFFGFGMSLGGDWTANTNQTVEANALKIFRTDNGQVFAISQNNSPRRTDLWCSNDGAGPYNVMSFGQSSVGFFGTSPVAKQTVTGSKAGNAALTSLIAKLVAMGLITDSTT